MEIPRRRTKSYFQRKERFLQLLESNKLRTNQELRERIKLKLKKKHSNSRLQRKDRRIKGWWRIARVNKAREIAQKLTKLKCKSEQQTTRSEVSFGELIQTKPSLEMVNGNFFLTINRPDDAYRLTLIELPERIWSKEKFDELCNEDPRRKIFYKPSKRVIQWKDYINKRNI